MSDKILDHKLAADAAASFSARGGLPGLREISRRIAAHTKKLRARYMKVLRDTKQESAPGQDVWLGDNYYVLEKESKQCRADIKALLKKGNASCVPLLFAVVDEVLRETLPAICDDTAFCILDALCAHESLGEDAFAAFPAAVRAALLHMAYRACFEGRGEKEMAYAVIGYSKLPSIDMEAVISRTGKVERILSMDPAGVYPNMTDESRRYYRYLISRIAEKENRREDEVASGFLQNAKDAPKDSDNAKNHIGHRILRHSAVTAPRRRRGAFSLAAQAALPLAASIAAAFWARAWWLAILLLLPLWEVFRPVLTQFFLAGTQTDFLPRMDPKKVKNKPKTVVLVSTLLPKASDSARLSERLEQLYFSNSDPDLYYCILADFGESPYPQSEQDEAQVKAARKVVDSLNDRYGSRFMLFLRGRVFNKTQNKYSGWERKRGAITEFIRFIKGDRTSVHTFAGDRAVLPKIKFVIALDADTDLLYESAQTMVSVAMHPVNKPVADNDGVVREGYGILCPKISIDLYSAKKTAFSRVMSGCGGVTAYETRDKDYYQDLFGESIFAGKGLIHIDSFYRSLDSRFPENRVLSHDILEGAYLRCGFVSDAPMSDGAPVSMTSWLSRLHRWLRGDWQNAVFIAARYKADGKTWGNPISALSKYKLADNLRRSLTPVFALLCLILALFLPGRVKTVLTLAGVLGVCFPSFWAAANSLVSGGIFTLSRKFFTRTLPHTMELVAQGLMLLIMLPAQSVITADAALRSLWRVFVSKRNMLEWTTAAQADARRATFVSAVSRYGIAQLAGLAFLFFAGSPALKVIGLLFALIVPTAFLTARQSPDDDHGLSEKDRDTLLSYNAAMWRYYEDFADEKNNFLPPDNIQQSPVYRVANRTSPTNIGMMLLSVLAARDMGFIDTGGLYRRIERTLSSVEKLETWKGNLLNWYDTHTLEPLRPAFVSFVDCGNFICSLVALKEGLREYTSKISSFGAVIARIDDIIAGCDLTAFYDEKKHLFSIGYDMESEEMSHSRYDFLMSEARLTSYYAVARKLVGKKHWGSLVRTMSRSGSYAGPVSWTGTMFEYFMPHLLLPVEDGSLVGEALIYCLYCQKKRTRDKGIPWGVSESAFYAFDNNLNYQYKAHGDAKLGVKRGLDRDLVISPYSTFITIPMNPNSSMRNLRELRELGVYGRYGFYEAVDFTESRVGKASLAVTRSYMAHHLGMSMVASANALYASVMQKRFMADNYMKSAHEFLEEKITKNTIVYDNLGLTGRMPRGERPKFREASGDINPASPKCMLLSNGEMTDILTDTGAGYLKFGSIDLTRRGTDLLRYPQGFTAVLKTKNGRLPATAAPFYDSAAKYTVEQQEQSVTYLAEKGGVKTSLRCVIHPTVSCQQRHYTVKNDTSRRESFGVLFYLEPTLCDNRDYSAHPAYSKLFVTSQYDPQSRCIIFRRRNRDATENTFLTVGFLEEVHFTYETRRENLMQAPAGTKGLLRHVGEKLENSGAGVPDACCALSFEITVPAGGKASATLLVCASRSREEGIESVISMRNAGLLEPKYAAKSPLLMDSLEGRLGSALLSRLLFTVQGCENAQDRKNNRLGQSGLWHTGVSGDFPIALIERPRDLDEPVLHGYLRLHGLLRAFNVEFDLVVLCDSDEEIEKLAAVIRQNGGALTLGAKGGVHLLSHRQLSGETLTLFRAVTRHFAIGKNPPGPKNKTAEEHFRPMEILPVSPADLPQNTDYSVIGGAFSGGAFYVGKDKASPLPWSHVLANPVFGTLVSDKSIGYTWAVNSRENKLTPWSNDISTGNTGELLLLKYGGSCYDLANGATAAFSPEFASFSGEIKGIASQVKITVRPRGFAKIIDVTLRNTTAREVTANTAYYTEPVLGTTGETARYICPDVRDGCLVLQNAYNTAAKCHMAITAHTEDETQKTFTTDRAAFLSGDWESVSISPQNDPCAAVIVPLKIPAGGESKIRFILSAGQTEAAAIKMAEINPPEENCGKTKNSFIINTPDKALDEMVNNFIPHQMLSSRIYGRCGFYQCGGAYGFRDQLQDAMAYLLIDPDLTKRHIIRCGGVQFEEGDVLHWWHNLPANMGGLRGVRTKFSDDLLWLPLAVCEYIENTGDSAILSVRQSYLRAEPLPIGIHERYISPEKSDLREDIYTHCQKALERGHNLNTNGLPLIGCGDWNDGFSSIGLKGKGTSVWLAMFLSVVLERFAKVSEIYGDEDYAKLCRTRSAALKSAVDEHCWDGSWYLRAFFDNGREMGGAKNTECSIDLLPQSFAVLSDMPDRARVKTAMENAWEKLADHDNALTALFTKPFKNSPQSPGYVKAYPPGLRENGGQYTHASIWFAIALLQCGETDKAIQVLSWANPAFRASDPKLSRAYKLEPYSIAADIYANPAAPGHGGWSLYTGAAAWYYRAVLEHIFGMKITANEVRFSPKLPPDWQQAKISAVIRGTQINLTIHAGGTVMYAGGKPADFVPLDGGQHELIIEN